MKYLRLKQEWKEKLPVAQNRDLNDVIGVILPEASDDIQIIIDTTEYIFGYAGCVRVGHNKSLLHYTVHEDFDRVFEDCKTFIETYYEQVEANEVMDKIKFPSMNQRYILEKKGEE